MLWYSNRWYKQGVLLSAVGLFSMAFAMDRDPLSYYPSALSYGRSYAAMGTKGELKALQRLGVVTRLQRSETEFRDKGMSEEQIAKQPSIIALKQQLARYGESKSRLGEVIARTMAGTGWGDVFDDIPIDSAAEGFGYGIAIAASRETQKVVTEQLGVAIKEMVGGPLEFLLKKLLSFFRDSRSLLFHNSHDPFTPEELKNWADLIGACLSDFEKLVKGRLEMESRSRDMSSRSFDTDDQSVVGQDQVVWECIVNGYVEQFDFFINEIDRRKGYYKENSVESFYANQLCKRLIAFKEIILKTKSLKDLSARFGANTSLIVAMANNIKNLFLKLNVEVCSSLSDNALRDAKKTTDSMQRQRYPSYDRFDGYGGGYPMPVDNNDWSGI